MSLTAGTGPFSKQPEGAFNVPIEPPGALLYFRAVPYRVRAIVDKQAVVDSTRAMLLHETGRLPVSYFPEDDLRRDPLEPSDRTTHCPFKGEAGYRSIRVGGRTIPDAVWAYREPIESARFLAGYAALEWNAVDEWRTRCAYKGSASYFHVEAGGRRYDDLVWTYPCPQHDAVPVRGHYCFADEQVELQVEQAWNRRSRVGERR